MSENATSQVKYFDLITRGIGYLNRARTVTPSQGQPYESVTIAALHGNENSPNYTYYDCNVVGSDATDFIKEHKESINDRDTKVLVQFNVGDGTPSSYEVTKGKNQGNRNHLIKARLLKIRWAKVGDKVFSFETDDGADDKPNQSDQQEDASKQSSPIANDEQKPDDQPVDTESEEQSHDINKTHDEPAETIKLDRQDPDYEAKMQELYDNGYEWDRDNKAYRKAA